MKILIALLLAACAVMPAASFAQEKTLEQKVADLEKRLAAVEAIPGIAAILNLKSAFQPPQSMPTPTPQKDAPLTIAGEWGYKFHDAQYEHEKRHIITYTLKNETDKDIKLIDASLVFSDRLGMEILAIKTLRDVLYPAGASVEQTGNWAAGYMMGDNRMTTVAHDDVVLTLVIHKVVFKDNTVWSEEGAK
jgi:hypothetical protein